MLIRFFVYLFVACFCLLNTIPVQTQVSPGTQTQQVSQEEPGFMSEEEKHIWVSSGVAIIPKILENFNVVNWKDYDEMDQELPVGTDMIDILIAISRRDKRTLGILNDRLKTSNSNIRSGIVRTLWKGELVNVEVIDGLAATSFDPDRETRFRAIFLLSHLPEKKVIPVLERVVIAERDEIIRCKAAEGLSRHNIRSGRDVLVKNLYHPDMWVREAAAMGLGVIKTKEMYKILKKALLKENINIVQGAIISSMNDITGISQEKLWEKYVGRRQKKQQRPQPKN